MSDVAGDLTFMMGEFEAVIPTDRMYAKNHMWAKRPDGQNPQYRFGFTAYSVRLLQDVYFLDWMFDAPQAVELGWEIGAVESKKAESSLFSPLAGTLVEFNPALLEDPSAINVDKYGDGWLFDIRSDDDSPLLDAEAYVELLAEVWDKTQKTIKGQLNS
jgi:glycine cleavage system H protein